MIKLGQLLQTNSYAAQLQTDAWKGFAREARQRAENACRICRRTDVILQVHHVFYEPNRKLWEYDMDDVVVLCEGCHRSFHEQLNNFRKYVFRLMRPEHLRVLNGALAVGLTQYDPLTFVYAIAEMAASPNSVERFGNAWQNQAPPPKPQPEQTAQ